jgi:AAA domain
MTLCRRCGASGAAWSDAESSWLCAGCVGVEPVTTPEPTTNGAAPQDDTFRLLGFDDLLALPDPSWLIDGLLPADGLGVLYGPSGSFKSFLALDWALSVATGLPWHGHTVNRPGWVVYIAAEGHSGLPARVRAWWRARGEPDMSRARWLPLAINFRDREQVERLRRTLIALPERPRLLVDDTMARSMVGGDENSAKDVGEFIAAVDSTPADLRLVVHHTGHNGSHERGSSALQGAADLRAKVERRGALMELTCEKAKDAEEWRPITLRIEPQDGGSCVLSHVAEPDAVAETRERIRADVLAFVRDQAPASTRKVREHIGGRAKDVDAALEALRVGGLIRREPGKKQGGWAPCPDDRDTLGHTPSAAPEWGPCPGEGDMDVVHPSGDTPPSRVPVSRVPDGWAPQDTPPENQPTNPILDFEAEDHR